ncbi:hypothetical protein [Actinomadura terrae]|uniref:hypothetical protein n=1 Tax=Actinomadura terrae TaxID=604353 RepID=UPI001FA7175C|nr:hypothetical protein [Actinomadura terrae]
MANGIAIAANGTATVKVTDVGGTPSSGVASVLLDVAAKATTTGQGALIVYPSGAAQPNANGARYDKDLYDHTLLWTKVGADGNVKIANTGASAVAAKAYVTLHGYTLTSPGASAGSTYVGVTPAEVVSKANVPAGGDYSFSPLGKDGVPASGVSHVVFTLVGSATAAVQLSVHASGTPDPTDTQLSVIPGNHRSNLVIGAVGADGKVTISGRSGTVPTTVWAYVSGYFAAPGAPIAGGVATAVQPASLVGNVSLASNADLTVGPLGHGGVPATGVTAVGLAVMAHGSDNGTVTVRPSGVAGPGEWTVGYPVPNGFFTGFINARLGSDGKVVVHNSGASAVTVWVSAHVYFTPSAGCTQAGAVRAPTRAGSPPAEPLPVERNTPTAALQASPVATGSLGALEYAYTNNIGQVVQGHQSYLDNFDSVQWTVLSGSEEFTGRPGLAEQQDGRLQVAAQHTTAGHVWSNTQVTKDPPAWGTWGTVPQAMASHAALVRLGDALVMFAVGADGALWALPQPGANAAYGGWIRLGFSDLQGTPAAEATGGGVRVIVRTSSGTLQTALYNGGLLSGCQTLPGTGFTGTPAVVAFPGNKVRVVARAADGSVQTIAQNSSGAFPSAWDTVGSLVVAGSPQALLSPAGKTEVLALGTDGRIHSTGETTQGAGEWRDWIDAQGAEDTFAPKTDPTVFTYTKASGPTWAFLARDADQTTRVYFPRSSSVSARGDGGGGSPFQGHTLPKPPARTTR